MKGLTSHQAKQLLIKFGLNVIAEQKKKPLYIKFFEQFNNFLTLLLIGAAIISFLIGEKIDGSLILTIVILNAFFGLYQEIKAEESIAALKKMTVTKIRVIRDGQEVEIESQFLVPGDIIYVEEGTKIPADGKIIETKHLEINESALTGESLPVVKKSQEEIFSGTIVAKGRGYVEITKIGMNTKFGEIAKNLSTIDRSKTPLQKKLEDLTRQIGLLGIVLSFIVFALSLFRGDGYFPGFLLAVSLAVAVVPEGLPAVMTITLAIGIKKLAEKKAIIRKLSAIEALGSITLIATDKTGTLTTNKMQVKEVFVEDKIYPVEKLPLLSNQAFSYLVLNGILCSSSSLVYVHDHGSWDVLGDPTEGALLYLAQKTGLLIDMVRKEWKIVDEQPFDSVSKMMSVTVENSSKFTLRIGEKSSKLTFVKGAPESILAGCNAIQIGRQIEKLTERKKAQIEEQVEKWARKGLRVLAFAYHPSLDGKEARFDKGLRQTSPNNVMDFLTDQRLTFLGLVAIHDAPRPEVTEAVRKAKGAGIKIVMITGDNEKTAEAVGVVAGIIEEGDEIITGSQLEEYSDQDLLKILPKTKIFARTNPFQKHRIIRLFQQLGEVVAVTGDGVNDAIALKQSDVGVAMGFVGTDVARETADMILTDDNFATLVNAIEEGRNIIKNIKNAIKYLLACNLVEGLSLINALLIGINHLFYPIQLLYINLVTDGLPALSLAFSPKDPNLMSQKPEKEMKLLKSFDQKYILFVGILGTVLVLTSYFFWGKTAAFTVLTLIQPFILIDLWLSHQRVRKNLNLLNKPIFLISFLSPFVLQFLILKFSFVANLFKISPLSTILYIELILFAALIFVGIKGIKKILF